MMDKHGRDENASSLQQLDNFRASSALPIPKIPAEGIESSISTLSEEESSRTVSSVNNRTNHAINGTGASSLDDLSNGVSNSKKRKYENVEGRIQPDALSSVDSATFPSAILLEFVLPYLTAPELARASCVSRRWGRIASNEGLWKRLAMKKWPSLRNADASDSPKLGFKHLFRQRHAPPAAASPLPFTAEDLTFFFDLSYQGNPVFSFAFPYKGGQELVPYNSKVFLDSSAVFPGKESLDKDAFRRSLSVNWSVVRNIDGKGVCLVNSSPDRCGPGSITIETPEPNPTLTLTTDPHATSLHLTALKLVFNTSLGGKLGSIFYGMMQVTFLIPLQDSKIVVMKNLPFPTIPGVQINPASSFEGVLCVSSLKRSPGLSVALTALKDRLNGTVRVQIIGPEFLLVMAALNWI